MVRRASQKQQTEWLFAVGEELYEKQNYSKAKQCFEKMLKNFSEKCDQMLKADACAYLSDIALLEGNPTVAHDYIARAIALDGNFAHYHYMAGIIGGSQEDFVGAIREMKRAVDLEPENSLYLEELGRIYLFQADFSSAEKYLKRAVASEPENLGAVLELLTAYFQQQKYEKFISGAEEAISNKTLALDTDAREYLEELLTVARSGGPPAPQNPEA